MNRKIVSLLMTVVLLMMSLSVLAQGSPSAQRDGAALSQVRGNVVELANPLAARRDALRLAAVEKEVRGTAGGSAYRAETGQFAELERAGVGNVWSLPAEFGDQIDPAYGGVAGPRHNQIPQPDRAADNTTIWQPDFNRAYYQGLLFSAAPGALSLRNYYVEQSSSRYAVAGDVAEWTRVPYNAARYGSNYCGVFVCPTVWNFIDHSATAWYNGRRAAGMSAAAINAYLSRFDARDRYDYDGDGNFDEPDGYIDHFQSIFAGQADQGFTEGIATHYWYAYVDNIGLTGPSFNKAGGARVGNSNYWIGDYVMAPENVGLGELAFVHGRDLGLPPLFDTGFLGNSVGFWSLMGSGSHAGDGVNGLSTKPTHLGPWEKLQLGWLDYDVAQAGTPSTHRLGPAEFTTANPQALLVNLPDKQIVIDRGAPYAGEYFYFSEEAGNLDNRMLREFDLPAGASLTAQVRYQQEPDWDYIYLIASSDGGSTWTNVATNLSAPDNPNGQNFGNGITGSSAGEWVELTADLSAFTGPTLIGFRHWTDSFFFPSDEGPFSIDEIAVTGSPVDGAESDAGWTYDPTSGFSAVKGVETFTYFNAYLAEYRQYRGFDDGLRTGPYTFHTFPSLARFFPYQDGLLIWYWDGSQTDNDVSFHQGSGLILPIDARPKLLKFSENGFWSTAVQSFDATFGLSITDSVTLFTEGQAYIVPAGEAIAVFDDNNQYWDPDFPSFGSVHHPDTNTQIRILSMKPQAGTMNVRVQPTP